MDGCFFCIPYEAPLHIILCKLFWDGFAAGSCLLNLSDEQLRIYTKPGNAFIDQKQHQKIGMHQLKNHPQYSSSKRRGHTSNWFDSKCFGVVIVGSAWSNEIAGDVILRLTAYHHPSNKNMSSTKCIAFTSKQLDMFCHIIIHTFKRIQPTHFETTVDFPSQVLLLQMSQSPCSFCHQNLGILPLRKHNNHPPNPATPMATQHPPTPPPHLGPVWNRHPGKCWEENRYFGSTVN